ncbi:MAG: histidine kinase [Dermatophilaceae bacterium]
MRSLWTGSVGTWLRAGIAIATRQLSPRALARSTGTWLRAGIVCLGIAIAAAEGHGLAVLPWALLVFMVDLAIGRLLAVPESIGRRREAFALVLVGAGFVGVGLWVRSSPGAEAFSLLIVPAFRAGEAFGRRAALLAVAVGAGVGMLGAAYRGHLDAVYLTNTIQWCGLAFLIGVLGAWSSFLRSQSSTAKVTPSAAREAAVLLRRLDALASSIDGGFYAPASAELLLDAVKAKIPGSRMAVLVGFGSEPAVPLALRGIDRIPWPDPTTGDSVLGRVWRTGVAEAGFWTSVNADRAIAAAPMRDQDGARIGVVVVDRIPSAPFVAEDLGTLVALAESHSANVDVAMIFTALRQRAAFEERERLAREMHDGIAQELVALGYRIDVARRQAATRAPQLAPALDDARADLSRVLTDLRLRIADLRLAVRPDQGLGAVVGARLQQFGVATGLTVGLRLSESTYRLPAHLETLIYRLILDVLADARHAPGASAIELRLDVKAPQAWLHISHDGTSHLGADAFLDHPLTALGAEILVQPGDTGVVVTLALNGRRPKHSPYLVPERMRLIP